MADREGGGNGSAAERRQGEPAGLSDPAPLHQEPSQLAPEKLSDRDGPAPGQRPNARRAIVGPGTQGSAVVGPGTQGSATNGPVRKPSGKESAIESRGAGSRPPDSTSRPSLHSIPSMIDGRYIVEGLLGEGTAGYVYLCRHMVIDKLVAIKVLRNDLAQDLLQHDRFANEARAASAIGSDHIVETLDFGHTEDGSTYIVMEYLQGATLGDLLGNKPLLPFDRVLHLIRQAVQGLGAAHRAGIVHRDVKPDNVFIVDNQSEEFVKILDFGVAKMASAQGALTQAGSIFGTPHYMSPEQASGGSADARADVYSVGVILHEMAAGKVPFDAEAPLGILNQHLQSEPPRLGTLMPLGRTLPDGYEAIVLKCLSKQPEARYLSMEDLDADLEGLERGLAPQALEEIARRDRLASIPAAEVYVPPRSGLRNSLPYYVLSASVLVVGGAWVLRSTGSGASEPSASEPSTLLTAQSPQAGAFAGPTGIETAMAPAAPIRQPADVTDQSAETQSAETQSAETQSAETQSAEAQSAVTPSAASGAAGAPGLPPVADLELAGTKVDLVLFPLNARVFQGEKDLGAMPVSVFVPEGQSVHVEVKHKGYISRRVRLDGSKSRVILGLRHWTESKWGRAQMQAKSAQPPDAPAPKEDAPAPEETDQEPSGSAEPKTSAKSESSGATETPSPSAEAVPVAAPTASR